MRERGFTLLELVLVLALVATLAALAFGSYRVYVLRAQAAQALVNVDQITTVVRIENRLDNPDLHLDAKPGAAPPRLKGMLPERVFVGEGGLTLWMIKAPAGTFSSYPNRETYALVATGSSASRDELGALRRGLGRADGDAPWLTASSFAFPIEPLAVAAAAPPASQKPTCANGSSWGDAASQAGASSWTGSATVAVCGSDGQPLSGQAGVRVRVILTVRAWNGEVSERSWDTQANLTGGYAGLSTPNLSSGTGGGETILSVRYVILGVAYYYPQNPPVKWDAAASGITVSAPGKR